jgi:peptide/nickel transport system permease protein
VPGDPVEAMLGESAQPADRAALRHALGLNRPLTAQYVTYLERLARLDLGESCIISGRCANSWASASRRRSS